MAATRVPPAQNLRDPVWLLRITRIICSGLKRPSNIEFDDSVQDACVIIFERGGGYQQKVEQGLSCNFEQWVITLVRSRLANQYAREYDWCNRRFPLQHASTDDAPDAECVEAPVEVDGDREQLDRLARTLPKSQRLVYECIVEGLTITEAAQFLHITKKTAQTRYDRAVIHMRAAMEAGS